MRTADRASVQHGVAMKPRENPGSLGAGPRQLLKSDTVFQLAHRLDVRGGGTVRDPTVAVGCMQVRRIGTLLAGMVVAILAGAAPRSTRAYSSFPDYVRAIDEGGGGGRLFTGTPADPYTCEVCHRGAEGAPLDVSGLPIDGYEPGQTYEITLRWPETEEHVALMAEFTDPAGLPTGTTARLPYDEWAPGEFCENDFPAADICLAGEGAGCCLDLDPMQDACSFPEQRSVLWVPDCRSHFARLRWRAPLETSAGGAGDVWFSAAMVTSDIQNNALGDGVTLARKRLHRMGAGTLRQAASGNCSASRSVQPGTAALWVPLCGLIVMLRRRMRDKGPVG